MLTSSTDFMGKHLEVSQEELAIRRYWWSGVLYFGFLNVPTGETSRASAFLVKVFY